MLHKKILLLLKILLFSLTISLPALAADIRNINPLSFVKSSDWVSDTEVKKFLLPDAFWCFEPEHDTCSFYTIAKGEQENDLQQGQFFAYDVIELWDSKITLTTPTGGILRENGKICEQYLDWIDNISGHNLDNHPVSLKQLEEMKVEVRETWAEYATNEYCFSYAKTNPSQPNLITQFEYVNGRFNGYSMNFIIDYRANAIEYYRLRLD